MFCFGVDVYAIVANLCDCMVSVTCLVYLYQSQRHHLLSMAVLHLVLTSIAYIPLNAGTKHYNGHWVIFAN